MNETHVNGVYELSKECFAIPWTLDSINNELNNPLAKYVVAQNLSTAEVVGFVGVWIIAGEGDITNIAVSPKYRKQGIASNLLINLFEMCKTFNCEDITLEVRASSLGELGMEKIRAGEIDDMNSAPLYIKKPQAERELEQRLAMKSENRL